MFSFHARARVGFRLSRQQGPRIRRFSCPARKAPDTEGPEEPMSSWYDQKGLNSCSVNAVAAAVEFDLVREKGKRFIFSSRLFLYYNTRRIEGTVRSNLGVSIRDTIRSVARKGDCPEILWPYIEHKFRIRPTHPPCRSATTGLSGTRPSSTKVLWESGRLPLVSRLWVSIRLRIPSPPELPRHGQEDRTTGDAVAGRKTLGSTRCDDCRLRGPGVETRSEELLGSEVRKEGLLHDTL